MATAQNTLSIDVKPFLTGLKDAQKAVQKFEGDVTTIKVDADAKDAVDSIAKLRSESQKAVDDGKALATQLVLNGQKGSEAYNKVIAQIKEAQQATNQLDEATKEVQGTLDDLGESDGGAFSKLSEKFGEVTSQIPLVGDALSAVPPQAQLAIGALVAVGAGLASVFEAGKQAEEALKRLSIATGATGEELERLGDQADRAFEQGVGESIEEAIEQVGLVKKAFGDIIPEEELGNATAKLATFGKAVGAEIPDSAGKIASVAKNFGVSFDEALSLVSAGAQNGVTDIGGYLDAVQEFGPSAKNAGLSAEEFFGRLQRGAEAGLKDLAKVGDGIKEVQNRISTGDLSAQVATVGGAVGDALQEIARLGEEGVLSTQEVLSESIKAIDDARASGEINANTEKALYETFGGSIAQDIGIDLYKEVFSAPVDTDAIQAGAEQAGGIIEDTLADQDPVEKLQRTFDTFIKDIGLALVGFYKQVVAPVIDPIIEGFQRVKQVLEDAFSGDELDQAGKSFEGFTKILQGFVDVVVNRVVDIIDLTASTIGALFSEIADIFAPLQEAFSGLFGEVEDGAGIFDTLIEVSRTVTDILKGVLKGAIKIVLVPFRLLIAFVSGLIEGIGKAIRWIKDVATSIKDWALSFEPLKNALDDVIGFVTDLSTKIGGLVQGIGSFLGLVEEGTEKTAENTEKAKDATRAWQQEVVELVKANALTEDAIERIADTYDITTDQIKEFAEANKATILTLARDVNQLAKNFNNALAGAQGQLAVYLSAVAGGAREFTKDAQRVAGELRKLEQAQDEASLLTDPARQAQLKAQRAQAVADRLKTERELTAQLIEETRERETKLLDIQQDADRENLERQIELQQALVNAGGAGTAEAVATLKDLEDQKTALLATQEAERKALAGQFARERLDQLIAVEQQARDASQAVRDFQLSLLDEQLQAYNTSAEALEATLKASTDSVRESAEGQVRALIEATPEFAKGVAEINRQVEIGAFDETEAKKRIDSLRQTLLDGLAVAGESSPLAQQIRTILESAERESAQIGVNLKNAFEDVKISRTSSDILRGIREQIVALERERDLLLKNTALTAEQREEIEKGYAQAIEKVGRGPLKDFAQSIGAISESVQAIQFDLEADDAVTNAEEVAEAIAEINQLLADGEITYQESLDRLRALEEASASTGSAIGRAFSQALGSVADSTRAIADESLDYLKQLRADREAVEKDTTKTAEQRSQEVAKINENIAKSQAVAMEQIGASALLQFGTLIAESENVGEALKKTAGQTVQSLIALYTPSIIGLFQSVIPPPFGLIAGLGAVGALNALVAGALASFAEGGYTGDGGKYEIAGVVHKGEDVHNQKGRRINPQLSQMIYDSNKGIKLDLLGNGRSDNRDVVGGLGSVAGILRDVHSALKAIPDEKVMRQNVGVELDLNDTLILKRQYLKRLRRLR